ncbi:MAG: hypothetical protein AAFY88_01375 [Acidobacteriota bacterium]
MIYAILFGMASALLAILFFKLFTTLPAGLAGILSLTHLVIAGSFGLLVGLAFKGLAERRRQTESSGSS